MDVSDLQRLGTRVRAHQDASLESVEPDTDLRAMLASRAAARPAQGRAGFRSRILIAALAVPALALGGLMLWQSQPPPLMSVRAVATDALSFDVDGKPAEPGGTVLGTDAAPTRVRFSDGSQVELEPTGQATVTETTARGAELVLRAGRARVHVVPRAGNAWRVLSGPFEVEVTGTRFEVGWDAERDEFDLSLFEGSVSVAGCGLDVHQVTAGERVLASCRSRRLEVAPIGPSGAPMATAEQETVSEALSGASASARSGEAPIARRESSDAEDTSWPALARQGHHARALALANEQGFDDICSGASAATVLTLATTARLAGDAPSAALAYWSVRDRFGGSAAAAEAAFGLGVLEAGAGRHAAARTWFEHYLAESPGGPLAAAALGRALEASVALDDRAAALRQGRQYLESYPTGPAAAAARRLLEQSKQQE